MSADASPAVAAERRRGAEHDQTDDQRAAPAEAVAERAGREQERRERERVGVDDPLLLRLAGVETCREMGETVGQHRDSGDDHHEREAHHREDGVAVRELLQAVSTVVFGRGALRGFHGWHSLSRASGGAAARYREQYSDDSRFGCRLRYYMEASSGLQGGFPR